MLYACDTGAVIFSLLIIGTDKFDFFLAKLREEVGNVQLIVTYIYVVLTNHFVLECILYDYGLTVYYNDNRIASHQQKNRRRFQSETIIVPIIR